MLIPPSDVMKHKNAIFAVAGCVDFIIRAFENLFEGTSKGDDDVDD
jgi:hypothetical protein